MSRSRFTLGYDHHNMVPAAVGDATVKVIWKTEDGIMHCYGTTVPTDGTAGYASGCIFHHSDADVLFSGVVDSGDATSLLDATLTATFDTNDELVGLYVINERNETLGLITDYAQSTGDITVADWTDYAGTAVSNAAPKLPVAGDAFKVLRTSSRVAVYINTGNRASGCKFKPMVDSGGGGYADADRQTGPSNMWDDAPLLEVILDPTKGCYMFEDFIDSLTAAETGGTLTQTAGSGTFTDDPASAGGIMVLDNAANTANHSTNLAWINMQCKPGVGTHIFFEVRAKMGVDDGGVFIGLADDSSTDITGSGTVVVNTDHAGFFRDTATGAAAMGHQACDGSNVTTSDTTIADVDKDLFETFGIHIFGDGDTAGDYVKFYHKGALVATVTDADGGGDDGVPDAVICPTLAIDNIGDTTQQTLTIDWMRVLVYNTAGGVRA